MTVNVKFNFCYSAIYEGRLQSSCTHLITPRRTLWRCFDGLVFEVPPLLSSAHLTTLHPLLESVLQTVGHFEIYCIGAPFSWLEKPRNRLRRDLNWILCSAWKNWIDGTPLEHPPCNPDLTPFDFWAFPDMKREFRGKKFHSVQWSAARFREVDGALWEVHRSLREILRKRDRHRTSTKFRLGVIRWVHEICNGPRTSVYYL
jgi:hypothetical protein